MAGMICTWSQGCALNYPPFTYRPQVIPLATEAKEHQGPASPRRACRCHPDVREEVQVSPHQVPSVLLKSWMTQSRAHMGFKSPNPQLSIGLALRRKTHLTNTT